MFKVPGVSTFAPLFKKMYQQFVQMVRSMQNNKEQPEQEVAN
jgi:hypothetical protein